MNFRTSEETITSVIYHEYPLTHGQAALWFHHKLAPEAVDYNLAGAVAIPGDTDLLALQHAFQRIAKRHPLLRTLFASKHGEPVQRVYESIKVPFRSLDASGWSKAQMDEALEKAIDRPFNLEEEPSWRVLVFQQAPISRENNTNSQPQEHLVILTLHHLIGDLWSIAIILSEIAVLYKEESTGNPSSLKPLRASYADHVTKESMRLLEPSAEISWDYWRTILSGELSPLGIPTDRPRPPVSTGRGAVQSIKLEKKLTDKLQAIAEKQHVALNSVLLTAFQTLLHRYTGQNDILVGFPKSGRSYSTVRVVGYFVNQTVVRTDFTENPRFIDLLNGVQKSVIESARHDWYPFSLLVQRLQPTREVSQSPIIQAVFSWQQAPRLISREKAGAFVLGLADQELDLDGLPVRSYHLPSRSAPFDLMMLAAETSDGLSVNIEYSTDLFDAVTIARMSECFRTLLENIMNFPEQRVSDLTILPKPEWKKVIEDWNATDADYPTQACLHQLFEQQVEQTPEMIAIAGREEQLTYQELNQLSNQLAHFLKAHGIGPDTIVGVCLEPSIQMVIALLAILKAGGAYLPLDINFPENRLNIMLADVQPALLLSHKGLLPHLPDFSWPLVLLDTDEANLNTLPQTNPISTTTPDHLAYVIYTSGSTGTPKGIALGHRGVVNLLTDFQHHLAIQPGDACSWWTSPSFDVSIYEIFSPLLAGGSLNIIPENIRLDAPRLLDWFREHEIRSAYLPPFFLADFEAWVHNHPGASPMHRLLVGVEPIADALLTRLSIQLPDLCVLNGYGPTETTICSTLYRVDSAHTHPGFTPIGRPVANTQLYLLDHALLPVPVGVEGELYIGGVGLAKGYLNQPDLTTQRFIQSPFRPGERLYRTGDLARYLPDGNLMFVGRSDTQVKLHGVRIELGEIEVTLTQHSLVKQAVVLLHELTSGGKHLVAYVVYAQNASPVPDDLRRFLNQRLPHSMVPTSFFVMDVFPLTSTGKIDRNAFPVPHNLQPNQVKANLLPLTSTEKILVAIWQQVLGIEQISVNDNFFELGGDSIMSILIVVNAEEAGLHLSPQQVFQAPTIASLATMADAAVHTRKKWEEDGLDDSNSLTPIQHWFFEQNFVNPHHWNQSLMFITPQPLDIIHLRSAVSALLMHHDSLRMHYTVGPMGWQQNSTSSNEEVPCEFIDLSALTEVQQTDAIETHVATQQGSLNLSTGPLIRVVYFMLGAERPGRLLIVIHHLAVDGISWHILIEDLQRAYRQHEQRQTIQLPPKTTTFQAWARRLTEFAQSPELMEEASFWLRTAKNNFPMLPVDHASPDCHLDGLDTESSSHRVSVSLGREETRALLRKASAEYGTGTNDILLTALTRAFQKWTGSATLLVDLESHGREDIFDDINLTRTVGWFTTLYPVHLELPIDAEPGPAIKIIKEQLRLIPHHGLGYGLLLYLCPDPDLRDRFKDVQPAQVSFNYMGQLPQVTNNSIVSGLVPSLLNHQRSPDATRPHLIEINAAILQDELHIDWNYSLLVHSQQTIEYVADLFISQLHALIAYCQSPEATDYTPSDFPKTGLSQAELDTILRFTNRSKVSKSKRNLEAIYPLSPMQQGMIFHTLYNPESGVYFEQTTFTIRGDFDLSAFDMAWQRVLARHTILRTSFVWQGLDRMLQIVHNEVKMPLKVQDWRNISPAEQQAHLESMMTAERRRGFNLSIPPLLRLTITRTADQTYHILFNHHHALLDGWSIPVLFKEVFDFYDASGRNQALTLPPVRPFSDFISWLQTRDLAAAETFWRKELHGFVPVNWAPARLSPPAGSSQPCLLDEHLSTRTTSALNALARRQHITVNTFIQGAWAILLSRHFQREDVLFGVTVAGRPGDLPGVMAMTGLFINTLPLRVHITLQSRIHEWLLQIQEKVMELQRYDYSPLTQIQAWSGIPRSSPLFDTILIFENYPVRVALDQRFDRLQISNIHSIEQTNYPLTLAVRPGQQLKLRILYDPASFESMVIQRLLDQLRQELESMVADPNQRIATILRETQSDLEQESGHWDIKTDDFSLQTSIDLALEQQGGQVPEMEVTNPEVQFVPPSNPLEKHLVQLWEKLLNTNHVGIHDSFFELGGDSLNGAICVSQLQERLGEMLPLTAIFEAPTVFELAGYLKQKHPAGVAHLLGFPVAESVSEKVETSVPLTSLVQIQPKGNKPPLFCIHPAGGIVFPYYTLAHYLGNDQPLYGIQDPSLYNDQPVVKNIEIMAAGYLKALRSVQPKGPYHLLGWSMGGVVAYEMAQQLTRQGQQVASLIMLDTEAPNPARLVHQQSLRKRLLRSVRWVQAIPSRILGFGSAIKPVINYIHSGLFLLTASAKQTRGSTNQKPTLLDLLGWARLDTWRTRLLNEAEVANTVSQQTSLLLVEMPAVRRILELVREHRKLVRRYTAEIYQGHIILFRGIHTSRNNRLDEDSTKGWGSLAGEGVEVHNLRANHVALLVKPHVEMVAKELRGCLDQSQKSPSNSIDIHSSNP